MYYINSKRYKLYYIYIHVKWFCCGGGGGGGDNNRITNYTNTHTHTHTPDVENEEYNNDISGSDSHNTPLHKAAWSGHYFICRFQNGIPVAASGVPLPLGIARFVHNTHIIFTYTCILIITWYNNNIKTNPQRRRHPRHRPPHRGQHPLVDENSAPSMILYTYIYYIVYNIRIIYTFPRAFYFYFPLFTTPVVLLNFSLMPVSKIKKSSDSYTL